jgi:glycerol-3-phosphate acyltransferase PlsY
MPGGGRYRWTWAKDPPFYYKILLAVFFVGFWISWVLLETMSRWARTTPDALHPMAFKTEGRFYYLGPNLAWYLNNYLSIHFGLFAILVLIMIVHRDKIERID